MREPIRDRGRLEHMLEHIDKAQQFAQGRTLEDLEKDAMFRYAVVKCLEIVGEAAYMLTLDLKIVIRKLRGKSSLKCAM